MPVIFIRHGKKLYKNNRNPPNYPAHDPPLAQKQEEDIKKITIDLISKYGKPDKIITSPFKRTRQTSQIIQGYIKIIYNYLCPLEIDNDIEEFLGNQRPRGQKADLYEDTKSFTEPIIGTENIKQCRKRAIKFYKEIDRTKNIWFITHGILMHFIYKDSMKCKKEFNNLEYFTLSPLSTPL
jgi:broad specificity phosphatase PhoE